MGATEPRIEPTAPPARLSREAFAEAFTGCSRVLWCIAAAVVGQRGPIEDVLQEGAIVALGKLDQFDPTTSFVAWMGRIVRYVALNHGRRERRHPAAAETPDGFAARPHAFDGAPASASGELVLGQSAFDDEVASALRSLEETARACLLLRIVLDLPYREISLALDIPEGTAMSHVHRARHAMRLRLEEPAPGRGKEAQR